MSTSAGTGSNMSTRAGASSDPLAARVQLYAVSDGGVFPHAVLADEAVPTDRTYGLAAVPGEVLAQPRLTAQSQSAAPDRTEEHPGVRVRQR